MASLQHYHYDHAQSSPRCSPSPRTTPSRDLDLVLALPTALVLPLALALTELCGSIFLVSNDLFSPPPPPPPQDFAAVYF